MAAREAEALGLSISQISDSSVQSIVSQQTNIEEIAPKREVRKRDGATKQPFLPDKILNAIRGAWRDTRGQDPDDIALKQVVSRVVLALPPGVVDVEAIQDVVEKSLMEGGFTDVAKGYILFRQDRKEEREAQKRLEELVIPVSKVAPKKGLLEPRSYYKPFEYPQFFEYFTKQNQAHWLPTEVPMENDILDFKKNLTDAEKSLITNILRFFTQSDIEVNNNYNTRLVPAFPKPEIKMMLSSFAAMEAIHVWAYSYLNDSLGLPDSEYSAFMKYEAMRDKYSFIRSFDVVSPADLALNLAVFGGFIEGVSLFSSFAILMNFPRLGKMRGVGQIVTWSIRDESLHSTAICTLFREFIRENPSIWTKEFRQIIVSACRAMVDLEDAFIDVCFEKGDVSGLKASEVKEYIRYTADRKLNELGLDGIYKINSNPLKWLDYMINGKEHANFFENRATEYAKAGVVDDWE